MNEASVSKAAKAISLIILINGVYFIAAQFYLTLYEYLYWFIHGGLQQIVYIYLLALPACLVFVISREVSEPLRFSTQLAIFLCICLTNQLVFAGFYQSSDCILVPNATSSVFASSIDELLYFSFLTFGTLGYGDFTPDGICRPVAAIQSIFGVMAVAILISLLSRHSGRDDSNDR